MLEEVYYEHYMEDGNDRYWERDKKSMPYMVLIRDREEREAFRAFLKSEGLRCVAWNHDYPGVLVNMELRRFGLIHFACKHSCVGDRNYTREEFMKEVHEPSKKQQTTESLERAGN